VARNYSQTMARENFFSHTGQTAIHLLWAFGRLSYRVVGENLFKSRSSTRAVSRERLDDSQGIVKTSCVLFSLKLV